MNPFKVVENLILGPPRLFVRTLDDFHTLVEIAADTNKRLERVERLASEMTQQLAILVKLVTLLEQGGETMIAAAKRVDSVAREVMALGDRIDAGPETIKDVSTRFEEVAGQMQQRARELAEQGAEVAAAVPILQRAMEVAAPSLEGALSRLGQLVAQSQPERRPPVPPPASPDDTAGDESARQPPAAKPSAAKASPPARKPPSPKPRPAAGEA